MGLEKNVKKEKRKKRNGGQNGGNRIAKKGMWEQG